jgi:hypothetical protein
VTKTNAPAEGVSLVYQCKLNLSTSTIYLADLLRSRLKAIRSPFRSLPPGRIAVLVLAMLRHDRRLLVLTDEKGKLIWISAARPGRTHDATAARRDKTVEQLRAAGLRALADLGFIGVDRPEDPDDLVIVTGYKATRARKLTAGQKQANRILAAGRAPVEHEFANLKA